jgi:PrtD family type I secretion system ABC transporter
LLERKINNPLTEALNTAKPVFLYMGLFSFFINLLLLLVPLYSLQVLDRVLSTGSLETLFWLTVIMLAAFLAASLLQALRSFALIKAGEWMEGNLSQLLLSMSLTHAASTGMRGTQNLRDLGTIKSFLTGSGLLSLFDAPWSVIALVVIFIIHLQLGMITLLGCIMLFAFAWLNDIAMHKPLDDANEASVKNFQQVDIAMRNAEVIEAMGMTATIAKHWSKANNRVTELQSLASYRSSVVQAATKFSRLGLQISITGWGAYLALNNEITSGSIIAASILAARALAPFDAAISIWKSLVETRKSYHRLYGALSAMAQRQAGISLPAPEGHLLVDKLFYGVPSRSKPILKGISFSLNPGDILGIIGPSAAGKSTLGKLCVGSWKPYGGVVRLDSGDVCQWKREEFGRYAGYLPQDIELFSGTVRDNIARMNSDASDDSIVKAAKLACAHDLIMMLPDGYDTDIGAGGCALSAGQRQRIGLARAFWGDPKLLVLDEPDASLDAEGEQALAQALANAKEYKITTLVITHRRTLLQNVNKLLYLNDGEIMLFGPTKDVMNALTQKETRQKKEPKTLADDSKEKQPAKLPARRRRGYVAA